MRPTDDLRLFGVDRLRPASTKNEGRNDVNRRDLLKALAGAPGIVAAKEFRIEPEDVLVVKVKEYLPTGAVVRMKEQIAEVLPGRHLENGGGRWDGGF